MTDPAPEAGDDKTSANEQTNLAATPGDASPPPADDVAASEGGSDHGHAHDLEHQGPPEAAEGDADEEEEEEGEEEENEAAESHQEQVVESDENEDEDEEEEGEEDDEEDDDDEDEEDDDEPRLKYARLTQHLGPVYRNADATSAFLVAGDKMVWAWATSYAGLEMGANSLYRSSALTTETLYVVQTIEALSCYPLPANNPQSMSSSFLRSSPFVYITPTPLP